MFVPEDFNRGELLAIDRAYIDYEKLEKLTQRGVVYVTKMKKGLKYKVLSDVMYMDAKNGMAYRIQEVEFTKKKGKKKDGNEEEVKDAPQEKKDAGDENSDEEVITHNHLSGREEVEGKGRQGSREGENGFPADQRLHDGRRRHHRHLQKALGDRDPL